jgi:hypothetical protein
MNVAIAMAATPETLGVLVTNGARGCLMIRNDSISSGSTVAVMHRWSDTAVQVPAGLKISRKLDKDCTASNAAIAEKAVSFYEVTMPNARSVPPEAEGIVYVNGVVQWRPSGWTVDGKSIAFRSCASGEGLHLSAWDGKPLVSKRIWHFYFYLGVEVEADCTSKDVGK